MEFVHRIDWSEELNSDRWTNHGRNILEDSCKHKDRDTGKDRETNIRYGGYCNKCGVGEDGAQPMMNFGYPLYKDSFSDKEILNVVKKTNCTVMENNDSGEYFLALCGGGMDLSQDIALAYILLEERIPDELIHNLCLQPDFSVGRKEFKLLMRLCLKYLQQEIGNAQYKMQEIKGVMKKLRVKV